MEPLERGARLLRRSANFAWYTNGGDDRVDHASPLGVAEVLITLDGDYIFTNNIEAPRVRDACLLHRKLLRAVSFGSFPDLRSVERVAPPLENPCRAPS
jgi:hypothetical protein